MVHSQWILSQSLAYGYQGQEYTDQLIRFIVDTETTPDTDEFFRDFKERLKERFRQIEIWMTASPIRVL